MAGRRPDIRAPLAIGTLVVALALLGLAFGGPLGSTAGSTEATPTPALAVIASDASNPTGSPASAPSGDAIASQAPSTVPTSTASGPEVTAAPDGSTPEPLAVTPTSTPIATPTPPPTATPAPTPCPRPGRPRGRRPPLARRRAARWCRIWSDRPSRRRAPPGPPPGSRGVAPDARSQRGDTSRAQDRSVGACLAPSTTVTVEIREGALTAAVSSRATRGSAPPSRCRPPRLAARPARRCTSRRRPHAPR